MSEQTETCLIAFTGGLLVAIAALGVVVVLVARW